MLQQDFMPTYGSNVVLTAAAATAQSALGAGAAANTNLRVVNTGAAKGYFRTYNAADAVGTPALGQATIADVPIPSGLAVTITKPKTHDSIAFISATGTTLEAMGGEGM